MTTFVSDWDNGIGACCVCRVVCKLTRVAYKLSQVQNSKKQIYINASLQQEVHNLKVFNNNNNNNTSLKFTDNIFL